jgi:phenylacetate-CoA ligase
MGMSVFDATHETLPRDQLGRLQLERVQALAARLRRNVHRYHDTLEGIELTDLEAVARLPVLEPEDLAAGFPYDLFALPLREVVRLQSIVGPGGRPAVLGHTRNDLSHWARLVARQLVAAGVTANDVIQICFTEGGFGKALGYLLGAELIEASVIPDDPLHVDYQLAMLRNYRTTVLVTTPTNAHELAQLMAAQDVDPKALSLRSVLLSRPVPADTREALAHELAAEVRCAFGVTELLDPGLCVECTEGRLHVNEDEFLVETRAGELLVTTLCREAMPLLRYATRITCRLAEEPCACGRTGVTLEPGTRLDDRMLIGEIPLYPAQVKEALAGTRAGAQPLQVEQEDNVLVVSVKVTKDVFSDTVRNLDDLKGEAEAELSTRLGVDAEVRLREPGSA